MLAAGLAVTAFSVKVAGDFDTAFREISTLIDVPIQDLEGFKEAILSYASTSTKPLEEVTQSIYNAISAGVGFADSIEAVALAEKLSVAGKATLNDSLVVLVSSLNAYGLGMEDAQRFSDALFTTVKQGQTNLPELAASLASVTGLAATAGVDFEELLAAVATLTSTGTPTSQAVTQIQGAISAILKPTKQASDLAKELGIEFNVQRLQAVGLTGILGDVKTATGGNSEQMAVLFGRVEALNGVLTLTGLGADKFAENLQAMASSSGSVDLAFSIMVQSIEASSQRVKNALNGLFIAIGAPLLDEFAGVAEAIAGIFKAIGDSARDDNSGIGELVEYIESQFAGLQATLDGVAKNLPAALELADFSGFTSGVEAVSDAVSSLFDGIDLSTAEGLAEAITLVGNAFNGLSQFTGGVIESFKPLFDQFTDVAGSLKDLDESFFKSLGNMAGFATQANVLAGAMTSMIPAATSLAAVIGLNQTSGLVGSFTAAGTALSGSTGILALLGKAGLLGAAGAAGVAIGSLANEATELATGKSLSDRLSDWFTSFTDLDDQVADLTSTVIVSRTELEKAPSTVGVADALQDIIVTAERWDPGVFSQPLMDIEVTAKRIEKSFESNAETVRDIIPVYDEVTGKVIGYTDGVSDAADIMSYMYESSGRAAEGLKELANAGDKLALEEKLAFIEAQTKITTAQIEADAQKTVAAFDSISVSVQSTGETISDLFGLFGDDNISKLDKLNISDQIELENERRQEALDLQKKLTSAQIAEARARTERLRSGDSVINISGDGLQPHLEAFMWEILETIQVRVNADGLDMLLGAP